jgi:hypothetical protein
MSTAKRGPDASEQYKCTKVRVWEHREFECISIELTNFRRNGSPSKFISLWSPHEGLLGNGPSYLANLPADGKKYPMGEEPTCMYCFYRIGRYSVSDKLDQMLSTQELTGWRCEYWNASTGGWLIREVHPEATVVAAAAPTASESCAELAYQLLDAGNPVLFSPHAFECEPEPAPPQDIQGFISVLKEAKELEIAKYPETAKIAPCDGETTVSQPSKCSVM